VILALNPLVHDFAVNRALGAFGPSLTTEYVAPAVAGADRPPPNLVQIYLEGFDRGFLDETLFGDTAAPLRDLERQTVSFTQVHQVEGTGWSLAAHVAQWCGLPLLPPLIGIDPDKDIAAGVSCLPDLLRDAGYHQTYLHRLADFDRPAFRIRQLPSRARARCPAGSDRVGAGLRRGRAPIARQILGSLRWRSARGPARRDRRTALERGAALGGVRRDHGYARPDCRHLS
jgi:hypothetical protein